MFYIIQIVVVITYVFSKIMFHLCLMFWSIDFYTYLIMLFVTMLLCSLMQMSDLS